MTQTKLSILTASGLASLSVAMMLLRWASGGADWGGLWKVTVMATGNLEDRENSFGMALPPDFRRQHIFQEHFKSKELLHRVRRGGRPDRREVVWSRARSEGSQEFHVTYSFRCDLASPSSPALAEGTRNLDQQPNANALKPAHGIESDQPTIFHKARELAGEDRIPMDQVQTFFSYVARLERDPTPDFQSAVQCLESGAGNSGGKGRLLVALCRNRGIPARLLAGLIVSGERQQELHVWTEAWVNDHWLPMCPTHQYFGSRTFPRDYLVYRVGEDRLALNHPKDVLFQFFVDELAGASDFDSNPNLRPLKTWWRLFSFYPLPPAEQHLVKFLFLLPLGALIVSIFRTLIGIPTFGTFGPALFGLAFLDMKALPWGLGIFTLTVLTGWGMRRWLDRYHLLLVPRTAILLTLIVALLIVAIRVAHHFGVASTQFIGLFPLVILTHLVERFWTVETEDGTPASFKTLLGTLVVAVTISLALSPSEIRNWMFRYPETIGLVLAAQFLIGRYTGYRLSELYRFQDLMREGTSPRREA